MTLYLEVKLEELPMRAFDMAVDKELDDGEMRDARRRSSWQNLSASVYDD
jgi:hypothetical protein